MTTSITLDNLTLYFDSLPYLLPYAHSIKLAAQMRGLLRPDELAAVTGWLAMLIGRSRIIGVRMFPRSDDNKECDAIFYIKVD
jgi:hypothetical protein